MWRGWLGIAAFACGGGDDTEHAPPDPYEGQTFEAVITVEGGGTLETPNGSARAEIPPGAVDGDTTLTVTVGPAERGTTTSVYTFGPEGTRFAVPVTLSVFTDLDVGEEERLVLGLREGEAWTPLPGSFDEDGRAVASTAHFSSYAGLVVGSDEVAFPWEQGQGDEAAMTYRIWTDPTSGLEWQYPTAVTWMAWQEALDYCDGLYLEGTGWRLPSIDELRTLIRDCPATEPGGSCTVADDCTEQFQCWNDVCNGCEDGGCNWPRELFYEGEPSCLPGYWSSTTYHVLDPFDGTPLPEDGAFAYGVMFGGGAVTFRPKEAQGPGDTWKVRCVR